MAIIKDSFTLYLASWQTRMVKDFFPDIKKKVESVTIKPGVIRCPTSYLIPPEGLSKRDWVLYLTDEQMTIVKNRFKSRTSIPGINITAELIKSKAVVFM